MSSPPDNKAINKDNTKNLEASKHCNSTKTKTEIIRETIEILRGICQANREGEEKFLQKELLTKLEELVVLENQLIETRKTISKLNEKYAQLS